MHCCQLVVQSEEELRDRVNDVLEIPTLAPALGYAVPKLGDLAPSAILNK